MAKLIRKTRAIAESIVTEAPAKAAPVKAKAPAKKAPAKAKAPAKKAAPAKAKAAKAAPVKAKAKAEKPLGQRAQLLADCEAGKIPAAPDFSAATHARFRKRLAEIVALVKKRDVKGLKAMANSINPISTSPKAMLRYATHAVIALEAQAKAGKRKAA